MASLKGLTSCPTQPPFPSFASAFPLQWLARLGGGKQLVEGRKSLGHWGWSRGRAQDPFARGGGRIAESGENGTGKIRRDRHMPHLTFGNFARSAALAGNGR